MFKVTVDDVEYEVVFNHFIPDKEVNKSTIPEQEFRNAFGTSCTIYENDKIVGYGTADLSPKDNFNRNTGRKVSLTRALKAFDNPEDREAFWNQYWMARGGKW
jgi:hypothetical protein